MNPSISMQVGQAAGDIVPVWGRVGSAWVVVIVEVGNGHDSRTRGVIR